MEDGSLPYGVVPPEIRDEMRRDTLEAIEARRTQYAQDHLADQRTALGILAIPEAVVMLLDNDQE